MTATPWAAGNLAYLPPAVKLVFVVMLWPAIWAGIQMAIALAGDLRRQTKGRSLAEAQSRATHEESRA